MVAFLANDLALVDRILSGAMFFANTPSSLCTFLLEGESFPSSVLAARWSLTYFIIAEAIRCAEKASFATELAS